MTGIKGANLGDAVRVFDLGIPNLKVIGRSATLRSPLPLGRAMLPLASMNRDPSNYICWASLRTPDICAQHIWCILRAILPEVTCILH